MNDKQRGEAQKGFGAKLRKYRLAQGLSQRALAERVGVSIRSLINYEQGVCQPRDHEVLRRLARELKTSVDYLLGTSERNALEAYSNTAWNGAEAVDELVSRLTTLFAGGYLNEQDRDAAMEAISQAYWESCRASREERSKQED